MSGYSMEILDKKEMTKEQFLLLDIKIFEHSDPQSAIFHLTRAFNQVINQKPKVIPTISRKDFMIFSNIEYDDRTLIEVIIPIINKETTIDDMRPETVRYIRNWVDDQHQQEVVKPIEGGEVEEYWELMKEILTDEQFQESTY